MPFAYYGAKHGLAKKYPRPRYGTIIEPFAGSAAYSVRHAATAERLILNDLDDLVIATWRRLQKMTVADVDALDLEIDKDRTSDPLLIGIAGSAYWAVVARGGDVSVTPRMRNDWKTKQNKARIVRTLPHLGKVEVRQSDYRDLPDIEATWLIDPPYQPNGTTAGDGYRHGAAGIDYDELADWCLSRRGQVIVCEQSPAAWLPFTPIATQVNGASAAGQSIRTEVVWLSDQQQLAMW